MVLRCASILLVVLLVALAPAENAEAQLLRGVVVHRNEVVAGARVVLTGDQGELATLSAQDGTFRFEGMRAGRYRLGVVSYQTAPGIAEISIGPRDTLSVQLLVSPAAVTLDSIAVTATSRKSALMNVGFYDRELEGLGNFIHRSEIEIRNPRHISEVLQGIGGLRVNRRGRSGDSDLIMRGSIAMSAMSNKLCFPTVFLDGANIRPGGSENGRAGIGNTFTIDEIVRPGDVEAIEVYRSSGQLPSQFSGSEAACGVVLIWTRFGR